VRYGSPLDMIGIRLLPRPFLRADVRELLHARLVGGKFPGPASTSGSSGMTAFGQVKQPSQAVQSRPGFCPSPTPARGSAAAHKRRLRRAASRDAARYDPCRRHMLKGAGCRAARQHALPGKASTASSRRTARGGFRSPSVMALQVS
jgi:hypothetical protein